MMAMLAPPTFSYLVPHRRSVRLPRCTSQGSCTSSADAIPPNVSVKTVEKGCCSKHSGDEHNLQRREASLRLILWAVSHPLFANANEAFAENEIQETFRTYEDDIDKFSIEIPQGWLIGTGQSSGIKSVTAFYPEQVPDSNVSVAITGVGPDFTRLESLGSVDAFAEKLVNGLDRSWQRPPGLAAKLIDSRAKNGLYYIEYTLQNPGERRRHILSAVGMAFNGWYNRLYTVTGQFMDDESEKYRPQIEKSVLSFRLRP